MKVFEIAPVKYLDGKMLILDQTRLPGEEIYIEMRTKEDVYEAIYKLRQSASRRRMVFLWRSGIYRKPQIWRCSGKRSIAQRNTLQEPDPQR